ncbi:MAG TPA: ATP synthase F1 subunit gamma [Tepidisphaeraceae bacterium]|jgi:F-type H+-transporting ATPase subunit gamma
MAKARAIVKRRKAVRNIRKITRTMQMIATAKFQKSLKRAVSTKPYAQKIRELVADVAANAGEVDHPLLRVPAGNTATNRVAFVLLTSNRGLAGGYNGNVIRTSVLAIKKLESEGKTVDVYAVGKKGVSYLTFQKRVLTDKMVVADPPKFSETELLADRLMADFADGRIDGVYVGYMNFISTGLQKPDVMQLLPLTSLKAATDQIAQQMHEKESQAKAGAFDAVRAGTANAPVDEKREDTVYEFSPEPGELLAELIPLAIKTAFFQTFLDAATSEHVARMVAMKAATDNAEEMARALSLQYNRARQSQITTELSEIMGGVESMKK